MAVRQSLNKKRAEKPMVIRIPMEFVSHLQLSTSELAIPRCFNLRNVSFRSGNTSESESCSSSSTSSSLRNLVKFQVTLEQNKNLHFVFFKTQVCRLKTRQISFNTKNSLLSVFFSPFQNLGFNQLGFRTLAPKCP